MSGMDMEARRRSRLATWVVSERKRLRWSVEQAARQAGINRITWERVEHALKVQDTTYDAVNKAFGLKQGGHEAIMANRQPEYEDATPEHEPEPEPHRSPQDPDIEDLQKRYDLDPDGAEAAAVLIRALRRRRGNSPDQTKKQA